MEQREKIVNRIIQSLRGAQKGLTVTEISREIDLNRNSCAKYLDILHVNGQVDLSKKGRAKIYYLSQRIPISALLDFSSDLILVLDPNLRIVEVNDNLITLFNFKKEMLLDNKLSNTSIPFFNTKEQISLLRKAIKGKESIIEMDIELEDGSHFFKVRLIPSTLGDGGSGVTVIMENITDQKLYQRKLEESEERYRELIENQGEGVGITDAKDMFTFANPAAERLLGVKKGGLIGREVKEFVEENDHQKLNDYTKRRKKGEKDSYIINMISEDGKRRKVLLTVTPRFSQKGVFIGTFGVFRDVSRMVELEERFRTLFDSSPDGIMMIRKDKFIYCNRSTLSIFKADKMDSIIGMRPLDLSPEFQGEGELTSALQGRYLSEVYRTGSKDFEWVHKRLDGSEFQAFVRLNKVEIGGESLIQATVRDISDLKDAQNEVMTKEYRIRNIASSLHGSFIGLIRKDLVFEDFYGTSELDEKYGMDSKDLIGRSLMDFISEGEKQDLRRSIENCFLTGEPFRIELQVDLPKGRFWQEWAFSTYRKEGSEVDYIVQFGTDTQEKNEILLSLKKSEERQRNILSSLYNSYIGLINKDHIFEDFWGSKELDVQYGMRADHVAGLSITSFSPPGHENELIAMVDNIFKTAEPVTIEVPGNLPGGTFWQVMTFSPFFNDMGDVEYVIMYGMDSTEKHELFTKLKQTEERYNLLDGNSSDVIWMTDRNMNYTYVSSSAKSITGYSPEDLIGINIMHRISGDSLKNVDEEFGKRIKDFLEGKPGDYPRTTLELTLNRKDGTLLPCELSINVMKDHYNRPTGLMGITRDISDRTRSWKELERRERILEIVENLSSNLLMEDMKEGDIQSSLGDLGVTLDVSRVYVFKNRIDSDGRILTSQMMEWNQEGIPSQMDNPDLKDFDLREGGFIRWIEELSEGRVISGPLNDMPESEQTVLGTQGIRSILITPINKGDEWWGFMGFDDCDHEREWSSTEIRTLRSAGNIIGYLLGLS